MDIDALISWTAQVPVVSATSAPTAAGSTSILPSGNGLLVSGGSNLTHTLPTPTSVGKNKRFGVKNSDATPVTVVSLTGLIDGQASAQVLQNTTKWFIASPPNWYTSSDR